MTLRASLILFIHCENYQTLSPSDINKIFNQELIVNTRCPLSVSLDTYQAIRIVHGVPDTL